ncbi:MAG: metallophosphoesterase [Clostridia bacterium]|nr:metallophosphoesterase [Clostridia bacterium]
MKKKIFAVSDIHGHDTELKMALDEAGFIPDDEGHLLIVCGDCFDRGNENLRVFEYLNSIQNKILIRGNHEDMLLSVLCRARIDANDVYNGIDRTVKDFFGTQIGRGSGRLDFTGKEDTLAALKTHIMEMYDYFETEHYVFTHGWLPTICMGAEYRISEDFRHATPDHWIRGRSMSWTRMYAGGAMLAGKTIVCGHRSSRYGCQFDPERDRDDFGIFYGNGVTAIDALTVQSGKVNVLVIEDELLTRTHTMKLRKEPFMQISKGKKRVELRLLDEKRQKIHVGDEIIFTEENSGETIRAVAIGLHVYPNFDLLSWNFDNDILGIPEDVMEIGNYMRSYYSDSDVYAYGALAIRLKILF